MSSLKSISIFKLNLIIPFLLVISFVYSSILGISILPDSKSYIEGYEIRTVGYPIIIHLFNKIFEENALFYFYCLDWKKF